MSKGVFNVPVATNEPVKSYEPGSTEREELLGTYQSMYNSSTDVPLYIGGETIYTTEKIIAGGKETLLAIEEFDDDITSALLERAEEANLELSLAGETEPTIDSDLTKVNGLNSDQINILIENDIRTQNDLAELATDELLEILPMEEEQAANMIMEARKPWFSEDKD